jgi:hypothetical protein
MRGLNGKDKLKKNRKKIDGNITLLKLIYLLIFLCPEEIYVLSQSFSLMER